MLLRFKNVKTTTSPPPPTTQVRITATRSERAIPYETEQNGRCKIARLKRIVIGHCRSPLRRILVAGRETAGKGPSAALVEQNDDERLSRWLHTASRGTDHDQRFRPRGICTTAAWLTTRYDGDSGAAAGTLRLNAGLSNAMYNFESETRGGVQRDLRG